jgi:elongation factor Ts
VEFQKGGLEVMAVSVEVIKQLRDMTLASVADCKKALDEAHGDLKAANELLKKRGLEIAAKKATRAANQGRIEAYVHTGSKIGVLLEVNSETDFVARNDDFARFTKDLAMQIAATDPKFVKAEDAPADDVARLDEKGKKDYMKTHCLLNQPFIKDATITIADLLTQTIARLGENIVIRRFARYKVGE